VLALELGQAQELEQVLARVLAQALELGWARGIHRSSRTLI
jgi:hypothetical protein